jgi:ubiquinone/menaquinone biosynthesis C-methylase UbiE
LKINIGSGYEKIEGFVTIDYDANTNPDYCVNIEKDKLPFDDNTVEFVLAHHVLEHLGEGYFHALQEIYRVCKHGAIIDIQVPHPRHDGFIADPTHRRPITPLGLQLFSKKYNELCKKRNLSASTLGTFFNVDFDILEWHYVPEKKYKEAFNGKSTEFIEEYINERNNIIREYHIKLVVNKD